LRVALDYTPAINQFAGVGRYTRSLFSAMQEQSDDGIDWRLWYSDDRNDDLRLPEGKDVSSVKLPVQSRWTNLAWHRLGLPLKIERYTGPVSVVHGTDFVVPPSRAPSVVTIHDLSYVILPQHAYPRLKRYLDRAVPKSIDRAQRIIAVSETTKRDLCEYYEISPNRVEVIYHAADPIFHQPTQRELLTMRAQLGLKGPYFITVGTIEPRKDHITLLKAFAKVNREHPNVSLVIVGRQGWLADDIMRQIEQAASSSPVFHLQNIRDEMLPALYGGSSALVYPSQYEGFGLPLLEAMTSGAPVIASDTPALKEIGADAVRYAKLQDADDLAGQMISVLTDKDERKTLISAGSQHAARFSWQHAAERHIQVYREVSGE
jgi:glycosyltransferase involved in cell wall biosynthesis